MPIQRNPNLSDVVRVGLDRRLAEVRTAVVGVVENYSAGKADVQILRPDPVELEDGGFAYQRGPVVHSVPVAFPGVSTKAQRITFPVTRGDFVTLVFSDRELSQWLQTGREVDPESPRMFDVSDAIAFLGPQPFTAGWSDNADAMTLGKESGPQIQIDDATIKLGSTAVESAVLGTTYQTALNAFLSALTIYATAIKAIADPTNAATPALLTAITNLTTALYLSTTVKVQ